MTTDLQIRTEHMAEPATGSKPAASLPRRVINRASQVRARLSERTKLQLKLLASLVMFASLFIFGKVDLQQTAKLVLNANPWILGITTLLFLSTMVIQAKRWQVIAAALGFRRSLTELSRYYFVGVFFNLFLPSTVGGDVSRCYYLTKGTGRHKDGLISVLADRASGIAVLFLSATLGLWLSSDAASLPWQLKAPIFAGTFGTFVVLPFMPAITRKLLGENNWITRQFNSPGARIFWTDRTLVPVSLAWSMAAQLVMVLCHLGVGMALGLNDVPFWYYFVFYPAVAVLGFITPSFNGIGIREWAYTYFLMLVGVDKAHGVTYALMWLALITFSSLVGGVVYVASHMKPPPSQIEPD